MNCTTYDFNSTPKTIDRNKYIESLLDFSTPMSTIPNQYISTKTPHDSNTTLVDELLQKFHEHRTNFGHTQTHLNLLDNHLREITIILYQLQNSLDHHSLLKSTTDQLETRLLQMSTKREQIRTVINHFYQSPVINQTLDDIIHQISPSKYTDPPVSYPELIHAIKLSLNQKTNLLERFHHEENHFKDRTTNSHLKIHQRQQVLLQLIEKLLSQQKINAKYIELPKPSFNQHTKQLMEFTKLNDEYQLLQNENRQLKQTAKENIEALYHFIHPTTE